MVLLVKTTGFKLLILIFVISTLCIIIQGCDKGENALNTAEETPERLEIIVGDVIYGIYTVYFMDELVGYLNIGNDSTYLYESYTNLGTPPIGIDSFYFFKYPEGTYVLTYPDSLNQDALINE